MDNMIIFRCGYMIIIIHWINKDFFSYLLQQIINQSVITSWEEDQVLFINLFALIQHIFFILQDLCILWEKFILKIQIVPKLSYSRFVLQYPTYWFCFANIKHYFYLNTNPSLLVFWHKFKDKIFLEEWDLVKIGSILAKRPPCKKRWLTLLNMQLAIDVQRSIIRECIYVSDKISKKMCFKLKTYKASGKRKKIMKIKHFIMKSKWGREVLNFIFYKEDMGDFKMKIFLFYISYYTILYST